MTDGARLKIVAAGAFAGLIVDTSLFPVDTVKSRLQSGKNFYQAGGFKNIYRGLTPILISSVPNGALYLFTYEQSKTLIGARSSAYTQLLAGASAEFASCCFKVPFELVKVNAQLGTKSNISILKHKQLFVLKNIRSLYAGFLSTLLRDVPFSFIQMPIWEQLKLSHYRKTGERANQIESALYGAIGGGVGAFFTCPFDVVRTRIMLSTTPLRIHQAFKLILRTESLTGFFAGVVPRITWISAGGGIFFGAYEIGLKALGVTLT